MAFGPIFVVAALLISGVLSSDETKKTCIKGKYEDSLGESFTQCYNTKRSLFAPRIKQCFQDRMVSESVVKVANDGQRTVDRQKFRDFGRQYNHIVAKAMQHCYNTTTADDDMYREAARADQCVFDKVKKGC